MEYIALKNISQSNIITIEMNLKEIGYLQHKDYKINPTGVSTYFRNRSHIDYHENTNYHFEIYNNTMITDDRVKEMLIYYMK